MGFSIFISIFLNHVIYKHPSGLRALFVLFGWFFVLIVASWCRWADETQNESNREICTAIVWLSSSQMMSILVTLMVGEASGEMKFKASASASYDCLRLENWADRSMCGFLHGNWIILLSMEKCFRKVFRLKMMSLMGFMSETTCAASRMKPLRRVHAICVNIASNTRVLLREISTISDCGWGFMI